MAEWYHLVGYGPTAMSISLSSFIQFVFANGVPKVEVVRRAKLQHNQEYDPRLDHYKKLRELFSRFEKGSLTKEGVHSAISSLEKRKQSSYLKVVDKYFNWREQNVQQAARAPQGAWEYNGVRINVSPEVCYKIDGKPYIVKHYLHKTPMPAERAPIIVHLMDETCKHDQKYKNYGVAIWDVRAETFYTGQRDLNIDVLLKGEANNWSTMWGLV